MSSILVDIISPRVTGTAVTINQTSGQLDVGVAITMNGTAGVITATSFSGDGSSLRGVVGASVTTYIDAASVTSSGIVTITNTTTSTSVSTGALIVSGGVGIAKSLFVGENVSIGGTLTYEDVTNVDSVGLITARSGVNISGGELKVGTAVTVGTAGIITATQFVPTTGQLSHRNLIINGAMTIAQRGTTSTVVGVKTVDRMSSASGGLDESPTYAQVDVSAATPPYTKGFRKAFKITNGNQTSGAGAADYIELIYKMEAQDLANSGWNYVSSSSYITLSFWCKSSVAQNFYFFLKTSDGTAKQYPFETGSLTADTWTKIIKIIPGHSDLAFENDTGEGLRIDFPVFYGTDKTDSGASLNAWANYAGTGRTPDNTSTWYTTNDSTFEITGLQLEVGSGATPFEHRSYGEELARCMRYYEGVYMTDGTALFKAYLAHGSGANFEFFFKVEKRITPTWALEGNAAWSGATPDAYESISSVMFQKNDGTLFSLSDGAGDLCGSLSAEF